VNLLVDTHVFLWWQQRSRSLAPTARAALTDPENRAVVSAATIWEISIKRHAGRLEFEGDLIAACAASEVELMPMTAQHAELAGNLPLHHTDPFDRMLIAQAKIESLVLVTQDRKLLLYGIPTLGLA
jgi:PIN domain nuclease of toxin-antitoxin system